MSRAESWLLAYDITCPRRLKRVHYRLKKRALFVQESVAILRMDEDALDALLGLLEDHLDSRHDDLRVYRVDWPDGAWLTGPDARGNLLLPLPMPPNGKAPVSRRGGRGA